MSKQNKLVSVIVPIYKVEEFLDRCVKSILNQTYKNLEVFLVDDGSPDNCPKMCDDWAKKDKRIKVIHKPNGGLSDARNAGLDVANGDYICFVDSDDFIHEKYVETLLNNLEETNSDLSVCAFCKVYEGKDYKAKEENSLTVYEGEDILKEMFESVQPGTIVAWSKLYKKEIFADGLRFDFGKWHEDEYIAHKVYTKCKKVVFTSAELYYYYYRLGSITQLPVFKEKNLEAYYAIENRYNYFKGTKWEQLVINQALSSAAHVYYIAQDRHASKDILKFLKQKFNFYYKQNKHKKLSHRLFKFSPFIFCKLKKYKEKKCAK